MGNKFCGSTNRPSFETSSKSVIFRRAPSRNLRTKQMTNFERFLRETLAFRAAQNAAPEPLTPDAEDAIKAAIAKKFIRPTVLPISAMKLVVLKLLSHGMLSGSEIIHWLGEHKLGMEVSGDGAVFGILHQMESDGDVTVWFDETTAIRKYQLTDSGASCLKQKEDQVFNTHGLSALWSAQ